MADYFYGQMTIGGRIPKELIPQLQQKLEAEGLLADGWFPQGNLGFYLQDGLLVFEDSDARYGGFEDLEKFLKEHGIEFNRWSDSKYEFDCELVTFRRETGLHSRLTDKERRPVVQTCDVEELLELDEVGEIKKKIRELLSPEISPLQHINPEELVSPEDEEVCHG